MPDSQTELRPGVLESLRGLTDAELVSRVEDLAKREHGDTALLVAHLAELDTRDVVLRAGYSSLFAYCRDSLALSEHEAYNRIEVARAARRFPVVLQLLASGAVNLTTVRLLAPHLTVENHASVLESARAKRRAEVEEIVARLAPFPEVPPSIRKLPPPRPAYPPPLPRGLEGPGPGFSSVGGPSDRLAPGDGPAAGTSALGRAADTAGALAVSSPSPAAPTGSVPAGSPPAAAPFAQAHPTPYLHRQPSGEVTPLAPDRYRLQCTIDGATLEKLRLAKDMLRHAIPSGDDAVILDRAFTALLADLARSKFAAVENPQPPRAAAPGSRHVPAEVKRAVWVRDLGRCAFVGTDGRRCNERAFVEFHHVRPYAAGGEATVENIQLRCRRHNGYEARAFFDRGREADGGGVLREPRAPYSSEPTAVTRASGPVSRRVRMPSSDDSSIAAAPDTAARAVRGSAGRPPERGSRPPPRHG
ncbi:MAG TPA: HNH endonuclease signature motif containing protein [Vicinamibacteria bacterium]|nr:HNH endonuclease signature motif containing protein [Vicinamibacteria bacterium]